MYRVRVHIALVVLILRDKMTTANPLTVPVLLLVINNVKYACVFYPQKLNTFTHPAAQTRVQ